MTPAMEMRGIDGANPVGFLAALGVLRLIDTMKGNHVVRLSWTRAFRPVIHTSLAQNAQEFAARLAEGLRNVVKEGVASLGDIIGVECEQFQKFVQSAYEDENISRLRFAAAYGSDAVPPLPRHPRRGLIEASFFCTRKSFMSAPSAPPPARPH